MMHLETELKAKKVQRENCTVTEPQGNPLL